MSRDRAALFSRKHQRYWIPVTGGMVLIGVVNIALGFCSYTPPPDTHERIHLTLPKAYAPQSDAGTGSAVGPGALSPPAPSPPRP